VQARARRAAAAVGLATVVVAAIGALYLRPWHTFAPAPGSPSPRPPAALLQLQFLSADLGWVVTGGLGSASLLRTTDGGRHWQRQLAGVDGPGWSLWFFDARRGMVYGEDKRGAALWRTTDGGQRWTRIATPCPAPPRLVFFRDLDHGWCIAPGSGRAGGTGAIPARQEVALFRTADGGVHWSQLLATDQAQPVGGGLSDEGQKAWIWFRDADAGWIGQLSPGGRAVVYATTDGGDHWNRQELPPPGDGWGSTLGTWEDGPQVVGGPSSPGLLVSTIVPGPQQGQFILQGRYLYQWPSPSWAGPVVVPSGAFLITDQGRWLVANGSSVLETSDGGRDWVALGQVPVGWLISRITMVDRDHGWAILFSSEPTPIGTPRTMGLARSSDGGRHWTVVAVPP
jgi:photosystem II stability/assembly factor-like uncharacterized protein